MGCILLAYYTLSSYISDDLNSKEFDSGTIRLHVSEFSEMGLDHVDYSPVRGDLPIVGESDSVQRFRWLFSRQRRDLRRSPDGSHQGWR